MTAGGGGKAALQKLAAMKRRRQLEDAPSIDMDRQQRLREKASRVAALMRGISNDFDETWSICQEVGAAHDAYEQARFTGRAMDIRSATVRLTKAAARMAAHLRVRGA